MGKTITVEDTKWERMTEVDILKEIVDNLTTMVKNCQDQITMQKTMIETQDKKIDLLKKKLDSHHDILVSIIDTDKDILKYIAKMKGKEYEDGQD